MTGITQNQLKFIAVLTMTVDHIGAILFPDILLLRIIGRLAFPIFSYSVYEGCRYTRRPVLYLLRMLLLGVACTGMKYVFTGIWTGDILITFSLSICILLPLRRWKSALWERRAEAVPAGLLTAGAVLLAAGICTVFYVDYGFFGVMVPVLAELADFKRAQVSSDRNWLPLAGFGVGLLFVCLSSVAIQFYSGIALLLLMLANGRRGNRKLKYVFYAYYPLHLAVLYGLALILKR